MALTLASSAAVCRRRAAVVCALALALVAANGRCDDPLPGTPYRLTEDSALLEGCVDGPCVCPVLLSSLRGFFRLVLLPTDGPLPVYELRGLHWIASVGEDGRRITGTGSYTIAGDQHALELDLEFEGEGEQHLTSGGLVPGAEGFPDAISIRVSTGPVCHGKVIELRAQALPSF